MANQTELLPLAKYADIEEQMEVERRQRQHIRRIQAVVTGPRLSFPDFIELHRRRCQYQVASIPSQFFLFARATQGSGNLTPEQWYEALEAWDVWISLQDAHDERDTHEGAADVAVQ